MAEEFRLEDPGEGLHEAEIVEIKVSPGDRVEDGDVVFVVETDKALMDLPAPFSGEVKDIRVEEDEVVEVGEVLLTYTPADGDETKERKESEADEEEEEAEDAPPERAEAEGRAEEEEAAEAEEEATDEAEEEAAEAEEEAPEEAEDETREGEDRPVPASPATRRLARELGVDLARVSGSGPAGRVTSEDVESFAEEGAEEEAREEPAEEEAPREAETEEERAVEGEADGEPRQLPFHTLLKRPPAVPEFSRWGPVRREPLRRVRRSVAKQMTAAWWEVPHVTHHEIADITDLEAFRKEQEPAVREEGGELTLTVMVLKAAVAALKEYPRFNASLDVEAQEIVLKDYFNLGLAVDTEAGLMVPVIRNVDGKSLTELSVEIPETVKRVREGEATQEDLRGGTFTLTNPGPLGGTSFTPLVRYPEVAILGTAAARMEPVVQGDLEKWEIVPRLRLPLVLAFDHRVNDGADAARFMNKVVETLDDIDSFLLNA